jgi:uncharacterized cysteine cluster protein YcgN (CxxCxxCC family)
MNDNDGGDEVPFWKRKHLGEMTRAEWESLCDGCGKCCLHKLRDEGTPADSSDVYHTDVACKLLDTHSCRCRDYENRRAQVPDCIQLTPKGARRFGWLPSTCAYRLVAQGRDLYWWHPLVSGDPETVHEAGISARDRVISEMDLGDEELEDRIVTWPE